MIEPIAPLFTGSFAGYRDGFVLTGDLADDSGFVEGRDLVQGGVLADALGRLARLHPEATRRAVASQWARAWSMAMLPVVTVASLVLDHELPIAIEDLAVRLGEDGRPAAFAVRHPGYRIRPANPFERFDLLVRGHFTPLFAVLAAEAHVSPRVLFGQAGFLFSWLVGVAADHPLATMAKSECHGHLLLDAPRWSDGTPNPLFRPIVETEESGERRDRKRVCCLAHELSEHSGPCVMCPAAPNARRLSCRENAA